MSTSLYQIETKYKDLFDKLALLANDEDALDPEERIQLIKDLEINDLEFRDKTDAYAAVITQKKAQAQMRIAEAERLETMAGRDLKEAELLSDRIQAALADRGFTRIETDHYRMRLHPSKSVVITDKAAIPESYQRVSFKREPDKTGIKQAIESGLVVPGAELINKQSLIIK